MTIYKKIEEEYIARAFSRGASKDEARRLEIVNILMDLHPDLSFVDETNIRLYFNEQKSLAGLANWIETK